jgi:hypothetical protein
VEDWVVGEVSGGKYGSQNLIGTRVISEKRGIQWDRCQIRVSWKGVGPWRKKKRLKSEGYHCDQNEERNAMD